MYNNYVIIVMGHKLHFLPVPSQVHMVVAPRAQYRSMESVSVLHFLLEEQFHQLQLLYFLLLTKVSTQKTNRIDATVNTVTEEATAIFPSRLSDPFLIVLSFLHFIVLGSGSHSPFPTYLPQCVCIVLI